MGQSIAERGVSQLDLGTVGLIRRKDELHRSIQDAGIEIKKTRADAEVAFKGKYGLELGTFSLIYSDPDLHKDGSVNYHHGNATPIRASEVALSYASALEEALSKQPKADRSKWLKGFFLDLSSVLQFQLPPSP